MARVPQKRWGQRTGAPRKLEAAGRKEKGIDGWTTRGVPGQPAGWAFSQFSSVTQACLTVCNPTDCSTPGLPVYHQLPEFTQTHVRRVGDAIQPSHPLLSPSPPASIFSSIRVLSSESVLHIRWPKYWSFSFNIHPSNEYSGHFL